MLTAAQFTIHLTTVDNSIRLGGPAIGRTQSSMIPVVNALTAYNLANTGANLLLLVQALGNLPQPKKVKYANALTQLYGSFPNPVYVTVGPFALQTANVPGIGVVRSQNVPSHQVDAILALRQLNAFAAGTALLQALCAEVVAGHRVAVGDAHGTASGGNECQIVQGMPDDYLTDLAAALASSPNAVGGCIGTAMASLGHAPAVGVASFTWLQNQINNASAYVLNGAPNVTPSSATHGANWISAATLQSWVNGVTVFPAGVAPAAVTAAKMVIGLVLRGGATAGIGGHTRARWNASNLTSAGTARPPYIGLGHELIHALHNTRGEQPGVENGETTPLYEYLCVGLGAFAGLANTENGLRAGAGIALRPFYTP